MRDTVHKDKFVSIDAHHRCQSPQAGQTVKFRGTVRELRDASPDELRARQAGTSGATLQQNVLRGAKGDEEISNLWLRCGQAPMPVIKSFP